MTEATTFDDVRDLYQEIILDHGRHPRNHHRMDDADGTAEGDNPMCGDRITVWVRRDAAGRIADASFQARGCAICIASGSLMTELCLGHDAAEAHELVGAVRALAMGAKAESPAPWLDEALQRLAPLSGVADYPSRVKCATLAWHALEAAMRDGASKDGGRVSTE